MNNPGVVDPVRTIINMALLTGNPPTVNTPFPSDVKVDYVRVYAPGEITTIPGNIISAENISVFPNPAADKLTINIVSNSNYQIREIEITDILGKQILSYSGLHTSTFHIDISQLPASHYQVRVNTGNGWATLPFIKS
jgi:hypothetical protein